MTSSTGDGIGRDNLGRVATPNVGAKLPAKKRKRDLAVQRSAFSGPNHDGTVVYGDMKTRLLRLFLLSLSALAFGQDHDQHDMAKRGDTVMGFSHEKTTHHFELSYDGGAIDVRANDVKDTESRDQILSHFRHIAQMFADGNFNAPMLVHDTDVPGTATMSKLKDQLHWTLTETPRGARLTVIADNKPALDAVHEFLRFQIQDHQTGDCPMVH